jgi:hypothetical protein
MDRASLALYHSGVTGSNPKVVWRLWRQDDAGNRYWIQDFATQVEALAQMRVYEERGHKQVYWVAEAVEGDRQ